MVAKRRYQTDVSLQTDALERNPAKWQAPISGLPDIGASTLASAEWRLPQSLHFVECGVIV
jgi:hypothetical protein